MTMKIPPHSLEIEVTILGSILLDNRAYKKINSVISETDFYKQAHRKIYETMANMVEAKEEVDLITINNRLKANGLLEEVGGTIYISQLTDRVTGISNVLRHAEILREKAVARELIEKGTDMISKLYEGKDNVTDILHEIRTDVSSVSLTSKDDKIYSLDEILDETIGGIKKAQECKNELTGIDTGFKALNRITSGHQKSDFIILAGRPSMGKSVLADNFLQACEEPSLFFSLEMSRIRYGKRVISSSATVDHSRTTAAKLQDADWGRVAYAIERMKKKKIYVDDQSNLEVDRIIDISERMKEEKNIGLIVIDYLQFVTCRHLKGRSREQEVSYISRKLKGLAKDLDLPVIALSQLNRAVEERPTKRPMLSDLRESGSIEQDADVVFLLYRPEHYNFTDKDINKLYNGWSDKPKILKGLAELNVAKGRDMNLGTIYLKAELEYQRFVDYRSDLAEEEEIDDWNE